MTVTVFDGKTESVILAGDLAIETGSSQMAMKPKTGPEMKETGRYLAVWKHQEDGSWKIIRDIGNSDLPAGK
jgi:ketosteroid isomerase-like protein